MFTYASLGNYGRLGNQLFQIAATYGASKLHGVKTLFPSNWVYRSYFNLPATLFSEFNGTKVYNYHEPHFHYSKIPKLSENFPTNLIGYFQSEKYFNHAKNDIINFFTLREDIENKAKEIVKLLSDKPVCFVHIRRGDYINLQTHHTLLPVEYFEKLMDKNDFFYLILSDSYDTIKSHFKNKNVIFGDQLPVFTDSTIQDFALMKNCNHAIISNSSYSWWGAYLIDSQHKLIYAPNESVWFGPALSNQMLQDLYPNEFIKTEFSYE